ncbi:hypothetical protein DSO57_1036206 [Entomophthora muscae]|uniref:Uncharacterized protein n=1 Tax=Entomophthora muscae TaxID=34485 RepID=A0ACC2TYR2_9FUNG|nr:hypothetical protein DSO57_1036206 [Entomophthora muscae]
MSRPSSISPKWRKAIALSLPRIFADLSAAEQMTVRALSAETHGMETPRLVESSQYDGPFSRIAHNPHGHACNSKND